MSANAATVWDQIWSQERSTSWRGKQLHNVYDRIVQLIPKKPRVIDLGGGVGQLGRLLQDEGSEVTIVDHSGEACSQAQKRGFSALALDIECNDVPVDPDAVYVGTEILEHLTQDARDRLLRSLRSNTAFWSVPNNRLGPDEEAQHTIAWTAVGFLQYLRGFYEHVRVECIDGYLLAVCGVQKGFTLSVTSPARDEADDIERVLKSFRGVADEIAIGIDPRSSDETEEIARQYAEIVFTLEDPTNGEVHEKGVHFAGIRNQCMDRCTSDWIFMTEAHEGLNAGEDELLVFAGHVDPHVGVIFVTRTGQGQQWLFPWLCRNDDRIRYKRATHNYLDWCDSIDTRHLRQIQTLHLRSRENATQRSKQRKVQNRKSLLEDWHLHENSSSLFYLGQEWRSYDDERAIRYFEKFLAVEKQRGSVRYQARLILARMYTRRGELQEARKILITGSGDDWQRTEHYLWLGDLAWEQDQREEALQWYRLAASRWNELPLSMFWFDVASYTFVLAQRLAMAFSACGRYEEAKLWAERVVETLPEDAPSVLSEEAKRNLKMITEVVHAERE